MKGKLYGIGVGPGDPDLLTLKAQRLLLLADRIFIPVKKSGEESRAFEIVRKALNLSDEKTIEVIFAMKKDRKEQEKGWERAAKQIIPYLERGEQTVLITLGDVSIYSTAYYVCDRLSKKGYEVETVSGVPSFCAGAAQAGISLAEGNESFLVVPSMKGMEHIRTLLQSIDNLVIMKAAKLIPELDQLIKERAEELKKHKKHSRKLSAYVVSNSGMEDEYIGSLDVSREYGYLTTVIIKQGQETETT